MKMILQICDYIQLLQEHIPSTVLAKCTHWMSQQGPHPQQFMISKNSYITGQSFWRTKVRQGNIPGLRWLISKEDDLEELKAFLLTLRSYKPLEPEWLSGLEKIKGDTFSSFLIRPQADKLRLCPLNFTDDGCFYGQKIAFLCLISFLYLFCLNCLN